MTVAGLAAIVAAVWDAQFEPASDMTPDVAATIAARLTGAAVMTA